ncbi:MAG: VC0807 family protein [Pseudobdellovibrio sp.]
MKKNESFSNILFNIIFPVLILNKAHKFGLEPKYTVILALSFPLFFALKSLYESRKINFIALLGLTNVLVSGTLTLLALGGIWFAIKEAAFPLLIGSFVLFSSWTKKPFFKTLFMNPTTFDIDQIESRLDTAEKKINFEHLMKHTTQLLSVSFLMSSLLNFVLSLYIFTPLPVDFTDVQKQQLLNEQLGHMTMYSMGVILVPSMLFLGGIMYYTFSRIHKLTGLTTDELIVKS